jgi:hypothetical protein
MTNKTVAKLNAHQKVRRAWLEDEDGYFADLKPGWVCVSAGSHTCHEMTAREILAAVANAAPCDCEECEYRVLIALDAPKALVHWAECRTVAEILRDCPNPEWVAWLDANRTGIQAATVKP